MCRRRSSWWRLGRVPVNLDVVVVQHRLAVVRSIRFEFWQVRWSVHKLAWQVPLAARRPKSVFRLFPTTTTSKRLDFTPPSWYACYSTYPLLFWAQHTNRFFLHRTGKIDKMGDADITASNWRQVEVGRVALFAQGQYEGKLVAIVQIIDHKRVRLAFQPPLHPEN